jgi:DNA-binding HxlR family transcriptional regulator
MAASVSHARSNASSTLRRRWSAENGDQKGDATTIPSCRDVFAKALLREAFYGTTRFDDFAERVGISTAVAAARLKELVTAGVLIRRPYQEPGCRTRDEYHLTARGRDLLPVLALQQWGDRHPQDQGPDLEVVDASGSPVRVAVVDSAGKEQPPEGLQASASRRNRRAGR